MHGRKIKSSYTDWASDYCEEYRYDENGLLICEETTKMWFSGFGRQ